MGIEEFRRTVEHLQGCVNNLNQGTDNLFSLCLSVSHPSPLHYVFFYRLALYVYEYLLHVGAQKSAQTFLSEVRSAVLIDFL